MYSDSSRYYPRRWDECTVSYADMLMAITIQMQNFEISITIWRFQSYVLGIVNCYTNGITKAKIIEIATKFTLHTISLLYYAI